MEFNQNVRPPENIILPQFEPNGSEKAFDMLMNELKKGKDAKILVYFDPDIDGIMSGLIVEEYLIQLGYRNNNYRYYLNENRAHGFKIPNEKLKLLEGYTIIAVDFSVEKEDFDRILKAGINLIVIDHHEIDVHNYTKLDREYVYSKCSSKNTYGIILNNQYPAEPENFRFLSGAGMVYYFLKYVESKTNVPLSVDAAGMVGISLLSDIRAIESWEARRFLKYTFALDSDRMKFFQWVVTSENSSSQRFSAFGVPCLNRDFIDFTFSPRVNAMLRANMGYEVIDLLRGKTSIVNEMKASDRILTYINIQKKIISAIMEEVDNAENTPGSRTRNLDNMMVCCLNTDFEPVPNYDITNYIGVACSKIKDEDKTGVILVVDKETNMIVRGSLRGGKDGVDYLEIFKRNGVPSAGHKNAFGILKCDVTKIDFDKIDKEIGEAEKEYFKTQKNTRSVLEVSRLDFFTKSGIAKQICKYNELSRDNYRIYVKVKGDFADKDMHRVKPDKVSDKFIRYYIDGVCVSCFDPSLDITDSLIVVGTDNNKYIKCTLRQGFEYDAEVDNEIIAKKLNSLSEKTDREE